MADNGEADGIRAAMPDPAVAHPSRTYDFLLGGKDNLAVDRVQVEENLRLTPRAPERVLAQRLFLGRAVTYMVRDAGIRQIVDIGSGMPTQTQEKLHDIALRHAPDIRYLYVDYNPVVVAHTRALLADDERVIAYHGDVRDPEGIMRNPRARAVLDFDEPVGIVLGGLIHFITDAENPAGLVARLRDEVPPGSHLAMTHISADLDEKVPLVAGLFQDAAAPMTPRGREQVERILDGFELVEPVMVPVHEWRPDSIVRQEGNGYGVVARKPWPPAR
jgi:S-adenosyl methyltransferase